MIIFAELNTWGFYFILTARSLYLIILTIYSNNKPPSLNIYSEDWVWRKEYNYMSLSLLFYSACLQSTKIYIHIVCLLYGILGSYRFSYNTQHRSASARRLKRMKTTNEDRWAMVSVMRKQVFWKINNVRKQRRFKYFLHL